MSLLHKLLAYLAGLATLIVGATGLSGFYTGLVCGAILATSGVVVFREWIAAVAKKEIPSPPKELTGQPSPALKSTPWAPVNVVPPVPPPAPAPATAKAVKKSQPKPTQPQSSGWFHPPEGEPFDWPPIAVASPPKHSQ